MNPIDNIITYFEEKKINIIDITSRYEINESDSKSTSYCSTTLPELVTELIICCTKNITLKYPSGDITCYISRNDKTEYLFKHYHYIPDVNYIILAGHVHISWCLSQDTSKSLIILINKALCGTFKKLNCSVCFLTINEELAPCNNCTYMICSICKDAIRKLNNQCPQCRESLK